MARIPLKGQFKDTSYSFTGPSLGPLPMPVSDNEDLDPTWRGPVVVEVEAVTFTRENGLTQTQVFPTGFTIDMMITRITLATTDAVIFGLE